MNLFIFSLICIIISKLKIQLLEKYFFEENKDKTIKLVKKINSLIIPYIKNKDDKKTNITENNSQKNNISKNLTITHIRSSEKHLTIDSLNKSENKCKNNYEQNKNTKNEYHLVKLKESVLT